jgi:penicillin amidase
MTTILKWSYRFALVFFGLMSLAALVAFYFMRQSLPDYDGELTDAQLTAPVDILRDHAAVPHIMAQTDSDALFALGYAHAQDRLWQMMVARRAVQGRLSETFGTRTIKTDIFMRRLGLYALAQQSADSLDADTLGLLTSYADGVNARLRELNTRALGRGAPEFFLFPMDIAPWQPADSIAMVKLMALQLSGHMKSEILRAQVDQALAHRPEGLRDILPDVPGGATAALPAYSALWDQPVPFASRTSPSDMAFGFGPAEPGLAGASNAFAAAPVRTAGRASILANDPHLGLTAPSIWYLAQLSLQSGDVIGGTIPGIPAVLVGRNADLAWGLTSAYIDDQDLVMEALNPADPNQYRTPNGYAPFVVKKSVIVVKDAPDVTLSLRWSRNGPVMPLGLFDLQDVTPKGHVPVLRWTALSPKDQSIKAAIGIMRARDIETALKASADYVAPAQNLMLADKDRIAMKIIGARPQRRINHDTAGRLPAPGWRDQNLWQGIYPDQTTPVFMDPAGGLIVNSNNKTVDLPFPNHLSFDWGDSQRILRLRKLLGGRDIHSRDSFIEAQLDIVSTPARNLLPLVGAELWYAPKTAAPGTPDALRARALDLLASWNGEMDEHRPEPLIYAAWMRVLQRNLITDDLGPLADKFTHIEPLFLERVFRNIDGAAAWCDIRQSSLHETCPQMAKAALDEALIWVSANYGSALEGLQWGKAHEARHDHAILGKLPLINYFVNIRQYTGGGDDTLMRGKTAGDDQTPFANVHAAGYRGVYDFSDPNGSVFIISTGQSGHFLSPHYDDMAELWRLGEYLPMSLDAALARSANEGITHLRPLSQ